MRGKGFVVLIVLTVAVVLGASMALRDKQPKVSQSGQLMLEGLLAKVNEVVGIDINSASGKFKLERDAAGAWVIPAREGFPVAADKVHKLLVGMANLQRLQAKTNKPERYAELGLDDPSNKDSRAVAISLLDGAGNSLASLLVGDERPAKGDATRNEFFVRIPGEARTWQVIGSLAGDAGTVDDWWVTRIAAINDVRIARAIITHADGEVVSVERKVPSTESFVFVQLPVGEKPAEVWRINDIGRLFVDLLLNEVKLAKDLPTDAKQIEFVTETFDGLRVHMRVYDTGHEPLAVLKAEFDESLVVPPSQDSKAEPVNVDKVRDEVKTLNERWSRWAYTISRFKGDTVRRRQKDLIREPEEPKAAKPAG
ncbi:MAG: hypothetical protein ACI8W7_000832 [Gammaproteobacteria bacterium]|jgi:hypothetical protein